MNAQSATATPKANGHLAFNPQGKTLAELEAEIARLTAQNNELAKAATREVTVTFKVGEKGALSMYGLGRFPVTLYKGQWNRLLEHVEDIRAALIKFDAVLSTKPEKK